MHGSKAHLLQKKSFQISLKPNNVLRNAQILKAEQAAGVVDFRRVPPGVLLAPAELGGDLLTWDTPDGRIDFVGHLDVHDPLSHNLGERLDCLGCWQVIRHEKSEFPKSGGALVEDALDDHARVVLEIARRRDYAVGLEREGHDMDAVASRNLDGLHRRVVRKVGAVKAWLKLGSLGPQLRCVLLD